jgi:fructoselysine-6-P-deglycase FrlB-like protein
MDPSLFLADLEAKPESLARLAATLRATDPWAAVLRSVRPRRVLLVGMGSSRYAAGVAALRLRAAGIDAVAEYGSAEAGWPPSADNLVVAISASGGSAETLSFVERHRGRSRVVAITENLDSVLAGLADAVVGLEAGEERSGIACRTFQHTGLALRGLEARLAGRPMDLAGLCERVAVATSDLLGRRADWLRSVVSALDGPDGVFLLAPAERLSSAEQGALMFREVARRPAVACETGDWSHVDVYLTKTLDYRALLFSGSQWEPEADAWLAKRGATVAVVGGERDIAVASVRYAGDEDLEVAALAEVLVPELVAAELSAGAASEPT